MLEVDGEQHDQRAGEHQPRDARSSLGPVPEIAGDEHGAGHALDDRIHQGDRRAARPAPPPQHEVADDRACSRTTRARGRTSGSPTRPDRRRDAARQAIDADVQEAAEQQAEAACRRQLRGASAAVAHGAAPRAPGSIGSGKSGDLPRQLDARPSDDSSYGVAGRVERHAGIAPAADQRSPVGRPGRWTALTARASTARCSCSI